MTDSQVAEAKGVRLERDIKLTEIGTALHKIKAMGYALHAHGEANLSDEEVSYMALAISDIAKEASLQLDELKRND